MPYTQANRVISIDTPLGKDVLLLRGFTGQEGLSQLPRFDLDLMTEGPPVKFQDIIGQRVTLTVEISESQHRFFNGFISRFAQTGSEKGVIYYRAEMVPWLWFLTRTADCRIFQQKTIQQVIEKIFNDLGFTSKEYRFDLTDPKGTFSEPLEYCVQYRETDYNFVARLLEQYGIFYFFEHEEKQHTLVLANTPTAHAPLPIQPKVKYDPDGNELHEDDVITSMEFEKELRPGKYCHTDYDYKDPGTKLIEHEPSVVDIGGNGKYEIYDYPGEYLLKTDGAKLAKIRMQEEEAQHYIVTGSSRCRDFTSGYKFDLTDFKPESFNETYLLMDVQHVASVGETYSTEAGAENQESYSNTFTCIPHSVPFRPPQVTPKPVVQGPQTAVVVGPPNEEIWCDEYGNVKIQFHWDREGKNDENSSCYVRVSQLWAGQGWGAMYIPRIGQEVIVECLEGDPDRPIITGRVYNGKQKPPYPLPDEKTKSTIKSNSSKGGGGSNEFRFEDKKGSEEIYLHGQKDWTIGIENDKNQTVGHDETLDVGNNRTKTVKVDQSEDVGANKTIHVGADHTETIDANKTLTVGGNHTETVTGNETITVNTASAHTTALARALTVGAGYQVSVIGAMNETVGGLKAEEIGGLKSVNVGAASTENIVGSKSVDAGGDITECATKNVGISAGESMTLTAGDDITIKNGKASIVLKKNGDIFVNGQLIQVNGKKNINMDCKKDMNMKATGNMVKKAKKILEN